MCDESVPVNDSLLITRSGCRVFNVPVNTWLKMKMSLAAATDQFNN